MIKKAFYILLFVFSAQIVTSCFPKCGPGQTIENHYTSVWITPNDNSGYYSKPVVDTVYKNAFGLSVGLNFESNQTGMAYPYTSRGFSSALAMRDCENIQFVYPDPIKKVELFVTDTESGRKINATAYFRIENYYGSELITLEEFFIQRQEWQDAFQFQLVDFDSIPNSAIFTAEAYLESGIVFMEDTEQVNFFH